jgi:hypothetical protein
VKYQKREQSLEAHPPPGPWVKDRACGDAPRGTFFPTKGGNAASRAVIARYCNNCPVRVDCLDYAMEAGPMLTGIWGGTTQNWRRDRVNKAAWRASRRNEARDAA